MSDFLLRIVRRDGDPVFLHPGGAGERQLIEDVINRALSKGVGFFHTEAKVRVAIRSALMEAIHELKSEVVPHR